MLTKDDYRDIFAFLSVWGASLLLGYYFSPPVYVIADVVMAIGVPIYILGENSMHYIFNTSIFAIAGLIGTSMFGAWLRGR
jgi:hypothetical protein